MRKPTRRLGHRTRQRQKHVIRILAGCAVIGAVILIKTTTFFSLTEVIDAQASESSTIELNEQNLISDFSVSAPVVRTRKSPDPSTIYFRKIKTQPNPKAE